MTVNEDRPKVDLAKLRRFYPSRFNHKSNYFYLCYGAGIKLTCSGKCQLFLSKNITQNLYRIRRFKNILVALYNKLSEDNSFIGVHATITNIQGDGHLGNHQVSLHSLFSNNLFDKYNKYIVTTDEPAFLVTGLLPDYISPVAVTLEENGMHIRIFKFKNHVQRFTIIAPTAQTFSNFAVQFQNIFP